jgi:glycosyltransferase involved in cell wall biosynthesis
MNKPFFTVVIPTHNRSGLLKRAVFSVLSQTFERFELIIVDDHSTDDTPSVAGSFSDPRIQYVINYRTKGACGARNVGIFLAKGEWVALLDDDDVWLPDKLKIQYQRIQGMEQTVGLVCTDFAVFKGKGKKPKIYKNRPSGWVRDKLLYGHGIGCLSSVCIRTEVLKAIDGFDERFKSNQDQDLWIRVAEISKFAYVPKTLVCFIQDNRMDRIGFNFKGKLEGWIMLRDKNSTSIDKSLRLRYRFESRIFTYAFLLKNRSIAFKCFPWVLLGSIIDFPHFLKFVLTTSLLANRKRTQTYHLN